MTDLPPPTDPFTQPPQVAEASTGASPAAKKPPLGLIIGALAAVAAVIVGVVVFTGGDDDKSSSAPTPATGDWHLVRYVAGEGEASAFEVLDADGAVVGSVPLTGTGSPALPRIGGRWAVADHAEEGVEVIDLKEGTSSIVAMPQPDMAADRALLSAGTGFVAYSDAAGAPLVLIDLAEASARTIGSNEQGYYPLGLRAGYSLYMAMDFSSSIIIPHDDPAAWWEVPGPVSAISGRETLVMGLVDDEPAVRHFDGEQQQGKTVKMKAPQYVGLFTATGATTVDTGGGIWSIDFSSGDYEPLGTLGIGVDGAVPLSADYMMTWNSAGSRVIAADGTVVKEIEPTTDASGESQPFMPVQGGIGSKCVTVQPGARPVPEKAKAITVDLATLDDLVHFQGSPVAFSDDGCSAISIADPQELMLDGALVDTGLDIVQTFSPDLTQFVGILRGDDAPKFFLVDVATGQQTDLSPGAYFWARF